MTGMTVEEIRQALGLQPFDDFATQRRRRNLAPERLDTLGVDACVAEVQRCTGRTTRMLVEALRRVSRGRSVVLRFDTQAAALNYTSQLRAWARQLNLDERLVLDPMRVCAFVDHVAAGAP